MLRVLVAEDSADDAELFETLLKIDGFSVSTVDTTEQVLTAAFSDSPPDVILLDLILDRADGLGVVQTLRGDPRTATLPIVAITAATPRYLEEVALMAGCTAFLTKPCLPTVLASTLKSAVTAS